MVGRFNARNAEGPIIADGFGNGNLTQRELSLGYSWGASLLAIAGACAAVKDYGSQNMQRKFVRHLYFVIYIINYKLFFYQLS